MLAKIKKTTIKSDTCISKYLKNVSLTVFPYFFWEPLGLGPKDLDQ